MHRLIALAPLMFAACATGKGGFDYTQFEGGTFQMTTTGVDDACFDGGFDVIFMPEGTPNDWATTTELPSWADLPSTYSIDLQDPFSSMEVTVEAGSDGELVVSDASQTDVELDADAYPGCLVDMSISASLLIVDADDVQGTATLGTASFDEENCPAVDSDPCDIGLDLTAARL